MHLNFACSENGFSYLVLDDAYLKSPDVIFLRPPTTSKTLFDFGRIYTLQTYKISSFQITAQIALQGFFQFFFHRYTFCHMRSSPYHEQTNVRLNDSWIFRACTHEVTKKMCDGNDNTELVPSVP